MSDEPAHCDNHAGAIAGWRCTECAKELCGKCTARLLRLYTCSECGAPARQHVIPRRSRPATHWIGYALAFPVRGGLPLTIIIGALLAGIPFVARIVEASPHQLDGAAAIARAVLLGLFAILAVDISTRSGDSGIILRLVRSLVATAVVWVPAALYVVFVGAPGPEAISDPFLLGFGGLAFTYVPIALAVAATDASFGDVANPYTVFALAGRLGKVYVGTLVLVAVFGGAAGAAMSLQGPAAAIPQVLTVAMLGCAIGLVPHVHGELLGWGNATTHSDPMFPRMVAEGRRKLVEPPGGGSKGSAAARTSSLVPGMALAPAERAEVAKVVAACKQSDGARALRLYEARTDWSPSAFDDRTLVNLGRAAQRANKHDLARTLFERAAEKPGRGAAPALLALAQLHATSLAKPDDAAAIYRRIVAEYPGTDAAKIAGLRLESKPAA